jgi:ribosomal protein L40E
MPEILTESFCERCGTRYTFEAEAPRAKRFGKFKVLSKGLKNYVLSDETSLDEALADARNDEDRQASGQQLDAFHKTFNFCMSCRQYTCANCWNEVESRCLSCAPHLGHEILEAPFQTPDPFARIASLTAGMAGNGHGQDLEAPSIDAAWPTADLGLAAAAETQADGDTDAEAATDAETDAVSRLESLFAIASRPDEPNRAPAPQAPPAPRADAPPSVGAAGDAAKRPAADAVAATAPDATADATSPAPKVTPAPAKAAKPVRDIALEVSLFEEETAQEKAEAEAAAETRAAPPAAPAAPAPAPRSAAATTPAAASDAPREAPPSELDTLDERAAAALSHTADFLTRFRSTSGLPADASPESVIDAATASEPEPVVPPAAPAQLPAAADPIRPQVDRIEFPTWHIETPSAPLGQPSGPSPEPTIVPTAPGPAMQPSVQARWPEPEAPPTPSFPVPSPEPAPTVLQASQPAAVTPPAAMPPAAMPTAAQPEWPATPPQWPVAPSWPANRAHTTQVSGVDAMWAASSRDVLSRAETGVQSCVNCGLPLSATARFCRRCGANQIQA